MGDLDSKGTKAMILFLIFIGAILFVVNPILLQKFCTRNGKGWETWEWVPCIILSNLIAFATIWIVIGLSIIVSHYPYEVLTGVVGLMLASGAAFIIMRPKKLKEAKPKKELPSSTSIPIRRSIYEVLED